MIINSDLQKVLFCKQISISHLQFLLDNKDHMAKNSSE